MISPNESDGEEDDFPAGELSEEARRAKVGSLPDARLLYHYDRLHHPALIERRWIPLLEAEIIRRGLRRVS